MPDRDKRVEFNILGRVYPVNSKELDGEKVEIVSTYINRQISQYKIKYAQLDNQDCLSMALIEKYLDDKGDNQKSEEQYIVNKLDKLSQLIEEQL